jgi:hypothetical protein
VNAARDSVGRSPKKSIRRRSQELTSNLHIVIISASRKCNLVGSFLSE